MKRSLIVVIIVLIIAGAGYYWYDSRGAAPTSSVTSSSSPITLSATSSYKGLLQAGFPSELIMGSHIVIQSSDTMTGTTALHAGPVQAISTVYQTASSSNDTLKAYLDYATNNNYQVLRSELRPDQSRFVAISRGADSFSALITNPGQNQWTTVLVMYNKN